MLLVGVDAWAEFVFICFTYIPDALWAARARGGTGGNRSNRLLEQNNEDTLESLIDFTSRGANCGIESTLAGDQPYYFEWKVTSNKRLIPWEFVFNDDVKTEPTASSEIFHPPKIGGIYLCVFTLYTYIFKDAYCLDEFTRASLKVCTIPKASSQLPLRNFSSEERMSVFAFAHLPFGNEHN